MKSASTSDPTGGPPDAVLLLEVAAGAWLGYGCAAFSGIEGWSPLAWSAVFAGSAAAVSVAVRWPRRLSPLLRFGAAIVLLAGLLSLVEPLLGSPLAWRTTVAVAFGGSLAATLLRSRVPGLGLAEAARWTGVLLAVTLLANPFFTTRALGSGDAHWYTLMLSDFVAQTRTGIFPVWVGQTEYAFNGAVNPLRLAPWYQHFAALVDLATRQRLDFIALKNLVLALNFLLLGAAAYGSLRRLLPARPNAACVLALLLVASPALLAPIYAGDQYMTFLALPFACLAVGGFMLVLDHDCRSHFLILSVGLAGLWLSHTPLAVWLSMLLAAGYGIRLALARTPGWAGRLGIAFLTFLALGSYPVVSALALDNTNPLDASATGSAAAEQIVQSFPGILLPLQAKTAPALPYQPGYAVLLLGALAAAAAIRGRDRAGGILTVLLGATVLLLCPIAGWASTLWSHLPLLLMKINGSSPQQRLVPIGAVLAVFLAAWMLRGRRWPTARDGRAVWLGFAVLALGWTGWQATWFVRKAWSATAPRPGPALGFQLNNLSLTRYAFSSFATTPGYYTHGYINPLLEHRLLRPDFSVLTDNNTGATTRPAAMLLASGEFVAVNDNQTDFYNLRPSLHLPERQQLALKLEIYDPIERGWLQVAGQDVFREYILPDSGTGTIRPSTRAFGTLPESSRIVPLRTMKPGGETPRVMAILPDIPRCAEFAFGRFELWQFDAAQLPVEVRSWAPYRLRVRSPAPALLETPRCWLGGYRARINDRLVPVQRTPDGLAAFAVPAGESDVDIDYLPSLPVIGSYFTTIVAWAGLLALAVIRLFRRTPPQRVSPA